ncbi:RICIN domain-containing protein [Streptomyces sp. NPDC058735]|uniref:RICIN domain-containing protein n=1 Tax=unclassified Streptomyces TaxID=2593676 RepID=UPI00369CE6E4
MSVRRAVTMRGSTGDPGGALAPGAGRRGPGSTPSTAAAPDATARTEDRAGDDPANQDPGTSEPENDGARKRTTERAGAAAADATARGIGAPEPSAGETPEPGASTPDSGSTRSSSASSTGTAAAAASASTPAADPAAPAAGPGTVSTAGASPDAATAASVAGSGGAGASGHSGDEPPGSRPKKPMLAAAAIVGAVLIAVPFLVAGQDDRKPERTRTENAAGTVLDTDRSTAPETYTSKSPTPSAKPSEKKEKKEKKKQPPPVPVVRKETPAPSPSPTTTLEKAVILKLTPAQKLRLWANSRSGVQNTVIKNAATGQCVDLAGYGAGKINASVYQFPCNNTAADNQLWSLDIVSENGGPQNAPLFLIRNSKDGLCLDLGEYGARAAGTKIGEFHCRASADNQLWWLDPREDGTNWIRNAVSNDLCLRPTGGAAAGNDAPLEIAKCGSGDRWIV